MRPSVVTCDLPREPHTAIICGQTGCGKTQFVLDELLQPEKGYYSCAFEYVFILCPTWKRNKTYLDRPWLWRGLHAARFLFIDPGEKLHEWLRALFGVAADTPTLYLIDDMAATKALTKKRDMLSELAFSGRHAKQSVWVWCKSITRFARTCVSRRSGLRSSTARIASRSQMRSMKTTLCHTSFALRFTRA